MMLYLKKKSFKHDNTDICGNILITLGFNRLTNLPSSPSINRFLPWDWLDDGVLEHDFNV